MLIYSKPKSAFPLNKPCMSLYFPPVLVEFDMDSPLLFPPHPKCVVKCYSKEDQRCRGVNQGLLEVLGVQSPQSAVPKKYGA